MYKLLSYMIEKDCPGWPEKFKIECIPQNLIKNGDGYNAYNLNIFNHYGTHIDAPNHFIDKGKTISEINVEDLIFKNPVLISIPKNFKELIQKEDIEKYEGKIKNADILLIKTGNCMERGKNSEKYSYEGTGFTGDAGKYLIENFKNLKAIALDTLSLASYSSAEEGAKAHEYLLGKYTDNYILIIEDADFRQINIDDNIEEVICLPLYVKNVDSAPVTMVAKVG